MNDDFLYQSRPPVRPEFARQLSEKLADPVPAARPVTYRFPSVLPRLGLWRSALLVTGLILALTLTLSEPVRAKTWDWIRQIAGFTVEERKMLTEPELSQATVFVIPNVAAAEILRDPPFSFKMPGWTPEGFELDGNGAVALSKTWVILSWSNPDGDQVRMLVEQEYGGECIVAGENSSQEIQVGCKPALLVEGNWNEKGEWNADGEMSIYWMKDGHGYRLIYQKGNPQNNQPQTIDAAERQRIQDDLVKMAESVGK